jgi:hypothetical protein
MPNMMNNPSSNPSQKSLLFLSIDLPARAVFCQTSKEAAVGAQRLRNEGHSLRYTRSGHIQVNTGTVASTTAL